MSLYIPQVTLEGNFSRYQDSSVRGTHKFLDILGTGIHLKSDWDFSVKLLQIDNVYILLSTKLYLYFTGPE